MFQIAGHTMGTPEYTVTEAIQLFSKIGADGAEIVVQDDYRSGLPCDCDRDTLQAVKDCAKESGIKIVCLTPYNSRFNSLDEDVRRAEIAGIEKVIDYCDFLGADRIRIYGGNLSAGETDALDEKKAKLIESMRYPRLRETKLRAFGLPGCPELAIQLQRSFDHEYERSENCVPWRQSLACAAVFPCAVQRGGNRRQ